MKKEIKLNADQTARFHEAHQARVAAVEASEMMARQMQNICNEAQAKVSELYAEVGKEHKLDFKRESWQFDPMTKTLRLAGIQFDG